MVQSAKVTWQTSVRLGNSIPKHTWSLCTSDTEQLQNQTFSKQLKKWNSLSSCGIFINLLSIVFLVFFFFYLGLTICCSCENCLVRALTTLLPHIYAKGSKWHFLVVCIISPVSVAIWILMQVFPIPFLFPIQRSCKEESQGKPENLCHGLTLAGCQVPTKAVLSLPSSTGQRRKNTMTG